MSIVLGHEPAATCAGCGTELSGSLLACPACQRLVHAATLSEIAARAEAATKRGEVPAALEAWRSALELLPPGSRQRAAIEQKVEVLASTAQAVPDVPTSGRWKWLATLGPIGLLLWKFKFLVVALLTKGKLLLLGLTNVGTLLSMFGAVAVYWAVWGIWFAVGLVVSIYIHEMGHVAAITRYGIAATAPMFIPGFGALIRLKQAPVTPRENARIGLAGPLWGLGAAIAAALAGKLGGGPMFLAIAHTGAWLNLFNLTPIWHLDGSRGFASLNRLYRWLATSSLLVAWMITHDGLVLLATLVAVWRSFTSPDDVAEDHGALALFVSITIALAVVFSLTGGPLR
jgi:Zn-dependent protease